jgi:hypothetical protein
MPDWRSEIRRRLAPFGLRPTREIDIVEEIGQHLDERYARSRARGASEEEAVAILATLGLYGLIAQAQSSDAANSASAWLSALRAPTSRGWWRGMPASWRRRG